MQKYEHENLGDVQDHVFIKATITAVDAKNDTADIEGEGISGSGVPIFYHCEPDSEHRDNGAIYGAAAGFSAGSPDDPTDGDEVIVMCEGSAGSYTPVRIVGFADGIRSCCYLNLPFPQSEEVWGPTELTTSAALTPWWEGEPPNQELIEYHGDGSEYWSEPLEFTYEGNLGGAIAYTHRTYAVGAAHLIAPLPIPITEFAFPEVTPRLWTMVEYDIAGELVSSFNEVKLYYHFYFICNQTRDEEGDPFYPWFHSGGLTHSTSPQWEGRNIIEFREGARYRYNFMTAVRRAMTNWNFYPVWDPETETYTGMEGLEVTGLLIRFMWMSSYNSYPVGFLNLNIKSLKICANYPEDYVNSMSYEDPPPEE